MLTAINAPVAVPPAPAPVASASAPAEPGAFARELERAAQAGEPDAVAAETAEAAEAAEETQAPAPKGPGAPARARAKVEAKAPERKTEPTSTRQADSTAAVGTERSKEVIGSDDADTPTDLQALLAGLMNHAPAPPSATPAAGRQAARLEADDAASTGSATAGAGQAAALPTPGFAPTPTPTADAAAAATLPAFSLPQPAVSAPAAPAEPAPPAPVHQAQVSAAVGTPEFAPGLSAEVNVMLRDGLQEARLQLNPAEMGPITVQIQIEGSNAQITLSAEQAPTRDALEQALPTLAGTLRDSGLTLTGGGVFEQPRPPRDDAPPPRGPAVQGAGGVDGATPVAGGASGARPWMPRGVVDLYA